jgi:CheY-like chemotaxis protein
MSSDEDVIALRVDYDDADDFLADYDGALQHGTTWVAYDGPVAAGTSVRLALAFPELVGTIVLDGTVQSVQIDVDPVIEIMLLEREKLAATTARVRSKDPELVRRCLSVLVVEDNPHVADLLRHGMADRTRGLGRDAIVSIVTAQDGHAALERIRARNFDALIVDVYLPLVDGPTLIATVRRELGNTLVPIIAVSAGGDVARAAAMKAGASTFLDKPMRLQHLVGTMRSLMKIGGEP